LSESVVPVSGRNSSVDPIKDEWDKETHTCVQRPQEGHEPENWRKH